MARTVRSKFTTQLPSTLVRRLKNEADERMVGVSYLVQKALEELFDRIDREAARHDILPTPLLERIGGPLPDEVLNATFTDEDDGRSPWAIGDSIENRPDGEEKVTPS